MVDRLDGGEDAPSGPTSARSATDDVRRTVSGEPPPDQGTATSHGSRPRPWPAPGEDRRWAEDPPGQTQALRQPVQPRAPGNTGRASFARRALSTLALLVGGFLVVLGIFVLVASRHQQGSGGVEAAYFCFIFAAPFVIVGIRGWQPRRPKPGSFASSRPPTTPTVPRASDEPYERPLPFPPPSTSLAGPAPASKDPERKTCPDCAETILAAAEVCGYCGYRFEPAD
jgi:hypothetical protein